MNAADDGDVVGDLRGVWEEVADPGTAGTMLFEAEARGDDREAGLRSGHAGEALAVANALGEVLVCVFDEARLVVEELHLGGATALEEIDDALGFGGKMRNAGEAAHAFFGEEIREGDGAEAECAFAEEVAARHVLK